MRKSIATVLLVLLIAIVGIVVTEGVYVQNFVANIDFTKRSVQEASVIESLNIVEIVKKSLQNSVRYSFYKASDEVANKGGYCQYNVFDSCNEECKIPYKVPTLMCSPWWRIYENTYEPSYADLSAGLQNETYRYFNELAEEISGGSGAAIPKYCPRRAGTEQLEGSSYLASVEITSHLKEDKIKFVGEFFEISEDSTNFTEDVAATMIGVYKVAVKKFIEQDEVMNAFNKADSDMPNSCIQMRGGSCDMTTSGCSATNCYDSNCCCKSMYFGSRCENDLPSCEAELSSHCVKQDGTRQAACNFNHDSAVTADEKFNCTAQSGIAGIEGTVQEIDPQGYINTDVNLANCIKVGHESDVTYINKGNEEGRIHNCACKDCNLQCYGVPSCSAITSRSYCDQGCSWYSACEGTATTCGSLVEVSCSRQRGCSWNSILQQCIGSATSCGQLSGSICSGQSGCTWVSECRGIPQFSCERDFSGHATNIRCENMDTGRCVGHDCSAYVSCIGPPTGGDYYDWVDDVKCSYNYLGTANVSVKVSDSKNLYPVGDWRELTLPFYVVSGNAGCSASTAGSGLCCPAITTDDIPKWQSCKTEK